MEVRVLSWALTRRRRFTKTADRSQQKNAHGPNPRAYLLPNARRLLPSAFFLAPVCEEDKKIAHPDGAVAVKISRAVIAIRA